MSVGVDGNRVRLVVEDSGPGIPDDERPKIFDRFHRAEEQGGYGSGLGLAIADAVVRHTHGRWEVNTSALGGARMAVSWPRVLTSSRGSRGAGPRGQLDRPGSRIAPRTGLARARPARSGRAKTQLQVAQFGQFVPSSSETNRVLEEAGA